MMRSGYSISTVTLLAVCSAAFLAGGCTLSNYMPRGYVGLDDTPLSSPRQTYPWNEDKPYSHGMQTINARHWLHAIATLSKDLKAQSGGLAGPLRIAPGPGPGLYTTGPLMASMDNYLREFLVARGIEVTTDPGSQIVLYYTAELADAAKHAEAIMRSGEEATDAAHPRRNPPGGKDMGPESYHLSLSLIEHGEAAGEAAGVFPITYQEVAKPRWLGLESWPRLDPLIPVREPEGNR